ncbi:MAG TPA: nucleotidyltransferase substrate binding protein [Thermodesulfovibrionia bacterium]|nr:nucleotidyltransferase substrate binding protein [Thermodesulfovibrionia bacterium]
MNVTKIMKLDFTSFKKALESLNRAILRSQNEPDDEELRDAVIQRFEYTYELSWKMLKRQIEHDSPTPSEIDRLSFRDLLRDGRERGLITDVEQWMDYREQRNITSHTYDEQKAESVYDSALSFYKDAKVLLDELERRNSNQSKSETTKNSA